MVPKTPKQRLDLLLVERELAASRNQAQGLIMANQVSVDGSRIDKPGTRVPTDAQISVAERMPYVSRGGYKLAAALRAFDIPVKKAVVADIGASTGGFTDCLLQNGASRVYAIDVGYGQLAWPLRQDPRVIVMERTNARHLESLPEKVQLVTIDASFISLTKLLPAAIGWLTSEGYIVPLIKPQFEAGKRQVGKGGVVRDPGVHRQVLSDVLRWAQNHGLPPQGLIRSPVTGPAGNIEFLALLQNTSAPSPFEIASAIENALDD